ncbi:bifunctional DNA primase/polymerase [Mycobacterium sp. 2YAF39]|uniref:bifunctional DNA primase/polymerase n=1 Tax=Mycobacterium sp. 2YAF39 TaxID=3233033 RepID=UPI003F9E9A51
MLHADDIGSYAIEYGINNWPIIPLNGKLPAIPNPHPKGSGERQECHGDCGLHGHGVYDATTDVAVVAFWWGGECAGCNIGGRVPESMFVLDMDPRNGGLESLAELETQHGPLPETLMTLSGRGDGGCHRFYRRPPGRLSHKRLGPGIDLKSSTGYVVLPPSIHPETGRPYVRIDAPVAAPPSWLIDLIKPEPPKTPRREPRPLSRFSRSPSIADNFTVRTSWFDILGPHGWRCLDADPDANGARWLHPTHTSACSATVRNGCLFVYSPNTVFDITEPGHPRGYTKFRAYAQLNHDGDLSGAAHVLTEGVARIDRRKIR